jgi:integral membrane sensor domain MASE1
MPMQQPRLTIYTLATVFILLGHFALGYLLLPYVMEVQWRSLGLSRTGLKIGYGVGMVIFMGIMVSGFNAVFYYQSKRRKKQVALLPLFCFSSAASLLLNALINGVLGMMEAGSEQLY